MSIIYLFLNVNNILLFTFYNKKISVKIANTDLHVTGVKRIYVVSNNLHREKGKSNVNKYRIGYFF